MVFLFCLCCFVLFGQNLIANGGFEERNCEPIFASQPCTGCQQLHCCNYWFNPLDASTSDYYTNMAGCTVKLPNTISGTINPYSGNAIVGFILSIQFLSNYHEYISTALIQKLQKGQKYNLTLSLAKGESSGSVFTCGGNMNTLGNNNGYSNHFGFYFSTDSIHESINDFLSFTPQIEIEEVIVLGPTEWKTYHLSFIAEDEYKFLTIGNFFPNSSTTMIANDPFYGVTAYYYIDDVSLEQDLTYHPEGKIIEPNVFTPNGDGVNDFFVPVLAEHIESYELSILNRWGEQVFFTNKLNVGWDGKIGDNIGPDGVYYWNMIYKDNNGKEGIQRGYLTLLH